MFPGLAGASCIATSHAALDWAAPSLLVHGVMGTERMGDTKEAKEEEEKGVGVEQP